MHVRRQVILLTGFGPFPGVPTNASAELVPMLARAAQARLCGFRVVAAILPTEWRSGPGRLFDVLDEVRPTLALHFGVSSRTPGFTLEMRGRNICTSTKDALGEQPLSTCIAENGPEFLPATLPTPQIVMRLRRLGLPASLSRDAGTYLCNALLYQSLDYARRHAPDMRAGFVHIPDTLAPRGMAVRRIRAACQLGADEAVAGGLEILAAALGRPPRPLFARILPSTAWAQGAATAL